MAPITVAVVGVGQRGTIYGHFALEQPERMKVVAAADIDQFRLKKFAAAHGLQEEVCFTDWRELAALKKIADAIIIATPDRDHKEPAIAFANLGYNILLEKPMAVTESDCVEIVQAVEKNDIILAVCHVLRYTPHAMKIRELITSGRVGDVINVQHIEPVGYYHYAHSYVRGNWRRTDQSTFAFLAKCGHDVDLLIYWLGGEALQQVTSVGGLRHFKAANKPQGATQRCLDCPIAAQCPYDAKKIYLERAEAGDFDWPVCVITENLTVEGVREALHRGAYGRCVYDMDNDVVDNQVVAVQYANGCTASLTMAATTELLCVRNTRISGSLGEITCNDPGQVTLYDFRTNQKEVFDTAPKKGANGLTGHGGADFCLMDRFVDSIANHNASLLPATPQETLLSHRLVFAAERARIGRKVVCLEGTDW